MSGYLYRFLKDGQAVIKSKLFPYYSTKSSCLNIALIGVGCNLGDCRKRFNKLFFKIKKDGLIDIVATSIIYKNPPFGYLNQPYFFNTLMLISTKLQPMELLRYLQHLEKYFKRKREFKNSPRTLDLDIILYQKRKIKKGSRLIVPHPHWQNRQSVLLPLEFLKGVKCLKRVL